MEEILFLDFRIADSGHPIAIGRMTEIRETLCRSFETSAERIGLKFGIHILDYNIWGRFFFFFDSTPGSSEIADSAKKRKIE